MTIHILFKWKSPPRPPQEVPGQCDWRLDARKVCSRVNLPCFTYSHVLARDLKSYQDTIATFNMPALSERFEFIRQLGNVFLIQPDILRSYITENYLGRIEPALLRPYLAQRADWGKEEKVFEGLFGEDGEGKGFKDRLGVSRMMRELEGLRIGDGAGSAFSGGFSFNSLNTRSLGI